MQRTAVAYSKGVDGVQHTSGKTRESSLTASISAVVATKNSAPTIEKCLSSLVEARRFAKLVVVDGHSKDGTVEVAEKLGAEICMERGKGFFGAYDLGFRRTDSDYIMFIDSDAFLSGFDFESALKQFSDPSVGLLICLSNAPVINGVSKLVNDIWNWRNSQIKKYTKRLDMRWLDRQYSKFFMSGDLHSGSTTTGPCYIMKSQAIRRMGGVDPRADDFVLARLLNSVGYTFRFHFSQSVFHVARATLPGLMKEYARFGLEGGRISRTFYTRRERLVGMFMFTLSVATAPYIAKNARDVRLLFLVPLIRILQGFGFIAGSFRESGGHR